jgi:hypothetical protein
MAKKKKLAKKKIKGTDVRVAKKAAKRKRFKKTGTSGTGPRFGKKKGTSGTGPRLF